jgi:hypothetical protein
MAMAEEPSFGCRLAHCRATMGRLIAGFSFHMFPQEPGLREVVVYTEQILGCSTCCDQNNDIRFIQGKN